MTNRLKKCLGRIIGRDQKAYVEKDNIGAVLLNILALIGEVNRKKDPSLLLLIDFKKAFDSIDHHYINSVLEVFGFGPEFRQWISLFFSAREASVLMGGRLTKVIKLLQGVPQGDIVSPFIFIIAVEILLIKLQQQKISKESPWQILKSVRKPLLTTRNS